MLRLYDTDRKRRALERVKALRITFDLLLANGLYLDETYHHMFQPVLPYKWIWKTVSNDQIGEIDR